MIIDFETEMAEIIQNLNKAEGYLDCEKVVIFTIKKHIGRELADEHIIQFLERVADYFNNMIKDCQGNTDCTRYRFAGGFIDVLLKMPNWKSWLVTMDL